MPVDLVLSFSVSLALAAGGLPLPTERGENLLQPEPLPDGPWQRQEPFGNGTLMTEWQRADGEVAWLVVAPRESRASVEDVRLRIEQQLTQSCSQSDSRVVGEAPVNGFERRIWLTQCRRSATEPAITAVHLYILGNEATYHLSREWSDPAAEGDVQAWLDYFGSVSACDTRRRRRAPCPGEEAREREPMDPFR